MHLMIDRYSLATDKLLIIVSAAFLFMIYGDSVNANVSVSSSGSISAIGKNNYDVKNLLDNNIATAWCSDGNKKSKPWFSITVNEGDITKIAIVNGYAKNKKTYNNNARVKRISVYNAEDIIGEFLLNDSMVPQLIDVKNMSTNKVYYFSIEDTYAGLKYNDICVSDILFNSNILDIMTILNEKYLVYNNIAMSENEICTYFKPLIDKYNNDYSLLYDAVAYKASSRDDAGLRLILDISYYQFRCTKLINVEFTEGLRDLIIKYILDNPEVVIAVFNDNQQLMRGRIVNAYAMIVSSISQDELKNIMSNVNFRKLSQVLENSEVKLQ